MIWCKRCFFTFIFGKQVLPSCSWIWHKNSVLVCRVKIGLPADNAILQLLPAVGLSYSKEQIWSKSKTPETVHEYWTKTFRVIWKIWFSAIWIRRNFSKMRSSVFETSAQFVGSYNTRMNLFVLRISWLLRRYFATSNRKMC